jgi:CDP-paratose 2-epimerase
VENWGVRVSSDIVNNNKKRNMKIVITGGLGFVGANLGIDHLQKGNEVIAIDNGFKSIGSHNNRTMFEKRGGKVVFVDIRNVNDVESFFKNENNVDVIFHMAAQVAFTTSLTNPRLDFEINTLGTFNILEAIRVYTPETIFINASTNQVYGNLKKEPLIEKELRFDYKDLSNGVPETYPLDFLSPYGCSKGAADQYSIDYARIYELNTVVTRFGGIYGDHQYSYEEHGWISFISEMVQSDKEFNRFGHGKQVRDVLYISDIIEALNLCVEKISVVKGCAINVAGGKNNTLSVLELLRLLEKLTGNREKSIVNPMRQADKVVMYLDISKAEKLLEWTPKVSKEEGIQKLLDWLKTRENT